MNLAIAITNACSWTASSMSKLHAGQSVHACTQDIIIPVVAAIPDLYLNSSLTGCT